jgi:hypothetical protein
MVHKFNETRIEDAVEALAGKLVHGKEAQRDIAAIGLKTVIAEVPGGALGAGVAKRMVPKLVEGIGTKVEPSPVNRQMEIRMTPLQPFEVGRPRRPACRCASCSTGGE